MPARLATALLVLLPLFPARAEEREPLDEPLADFLAAPTVEEREAASKAILALAPEPAEVLARLRRGPRHGMPARDWSVRKHRYPDGVERPYHLYIPSTYDPAEPAPLLFHMHGGVNRPALIPEERMKGYRDWWKAEAEERGILVVFPLGQQGAAWWDETGARGIVGIRSDLARDLNVDEDRVFATGFSDGGSGAFYLGLTHPTSFAGFIPLNGHPAVAQQASGKQLYPANAKLRPWYVVNTQADQLYPSRTVMPFVLRMIEIDASVKFVTYPGIGHEPAYREEQNPLIAEWVCETKRVPLPRRIAWETADLELGRAAWVTVLELGETPGAPAFPDVNVTTPDQGVKVGVYLDGDFPGPGVRVERTLPGSLAARVGLQAGDVITGLGGAEIGSRNDLAAALGKMSHGQKVTVAWRRGEEEMSVEGSIPPFTPSPFFRRERPSGRIEVEAQGNRVVVGLNGVTRYALDVSPDLFDLEKEIVVTTNGRESFRGKVAPDLGHLLRTFARDRDRSMLFTGRIEVAVGE